MRDIVDLSGLEGSDLAKDPVRFGALMLVDSDYIYHARLIQTPDGRWISIEQALNTGYETSEVSSLKSNYEWVKEGYKTNDSEKMEQGLKAFSSKLNELNRKSGFIPLGIVVETPRDLHDVISVAERVEVFVKIIESKEPIVLNLENSKFSQISIYLTQDQKDVSFILGKLDTKPTELPDPPGPAWTYIEMDVNLPEDSIESAVIKFWISKEWLKDRRVAKENVALFKYNEKLKAFWPFSTSWAELQTEIVEENATHVYYMARSLGFSTFAVVAKTPPVVALAIISVIALVATAIVFWFFSRSRVRFCHRCGT